jgi:PAT family beta-lactamase induction signal transducer AmpG
MSSPSEQSLSGLPIGPSQPDGEIEPGTQRDLEPATSALGGNEPLPLEYHTSRGKRINPWLFVPVLYLMQGMPVTTVQEMFTVTWKDLSVANPLIVSWSAILAIPWTLKLFWSPLVDLKSTKRRWTISMQALLTLAFVALVFAVMLPQYGHDTPRTGFYITLGLLLLMGCLSSTHDIACDGLYIISLTKKQQALWVGVQGTCYKLGRWLCVGLLVIVAGELEKHGFSIAKSWSIVLIIAACIYGGGAVYNWFFLPAPPGDKPAVEEAPGETRRNVYRTATVVAIGICLYFVFASSIRILGDWIYDALNLHRAGAEVILKDWSQGTTLQPIHFLGIPVGVHYPVFQQYLIWIVSVGILIPLILAARAQLRGTAMAMSFGSYVNQRGFWAIFLFVMLYRFGESMVTRTLPLFLKDPVSHGGLGVSTADVGIIVGTFGVFGIIFGGLLGGVIVSRLGLRRSFWPLAIAMHAPNLLYLMIAIFYVPSSLPHHWQNFGINNWPLSIAAFVHEFGYGFGFAAYFVFLMDVAQRANFTTSHYAFGTGLGALCGVFAGIVSAILLASLHGPQTYVWFFTAVCILTVPGMLTLLIIPLEKGGVGAGRAAT